jgi:hypothetical protein
MFRSRVLTACTIARSIRSLGLGPSRGLGCPVLALGASPVYILFLVLPLSSPKGLLLFTQLFSPRLGLSASPVLTVHNAFTEDDASEEEREEGNSVLLDGLRCFGYRYDSLLLHFVLSQQPSCTNTSRRLLQAGPPSSTPFAAKAS